MLVGFNLYTYHGDNLDGVLHNETPGIYVIADNGASGGLMRNSEGGTSPWAGYTWMTPDGRFRLTVGGALGYIDTPVKPIVLPSVKIYDFAIGAMPKTPSTKTWMITFGYEKKF